jgi:FtsP/CotA-like multicopper oxidase with cupredoxin domain
LFIVRKVGGEKKKKQKMSSVTINNIVKGNQPAFTGMSTSSKRTPPVILEGIRNEIIHQGENLNLVVKASGSDLKYRWVKSSSSSGNSNTSMLVSPSTNTNTNTNTFNPSKPVLMIDNKTNHLQIDDVKLMNGGVYTVFVYNQYGEVSSSCMVDVKMMMTDTTTDPSPASTITINVIENVSKLINIDYEDLKQANATFTQSSAVTLKFDKLEIFPEGILRIPHLYGVYSITQMQTVPTTIASFKLLFTVPKTWFLKNNYRFESVKLNRYATGAWFELTTTRNTAMTDDTHYFYESIVPGFSFFGITATLYDTIANPGGTPKYFGPSPNWALSPLPQGRLCNTVNIVSGGAGYTNPIIKVIDFFYGAVANPATATVTVTDGVITAVNITKKGSGYTYPVFLVDDDNVTEPADLAGTIEPYGLDQISRVIVNVPGSNVSSLNVVATNGAVLNPVIINGQIVSVDVLNPGENNPNITITGTYDIIPVFIVELGGYGGGIRKFVNEVPDSSSLVAIPNKTRYEGCDYYQIGIVEFEHKFHVDLPPTRVRGYVQVDIEKDVTGNSYFNFTSPFSLTNVDGTPIQFQGTTVVSATKPMYMGGGINATKGRPVRIKFYNLLPVNDKGKHILPVDTTIMGAGENMNNYEMYPENRTVIHLHGNNSAWISDGSPHQWFTPEGEMTSQKKGINVYDAPDMPSEDGSITIHYTNNQSSRLLFYHDHAYGLTRLNFYIGEATFYNITDDVEKDLIEGTNNTTVNPNSFKIPEAKILMIQDKTFVDKNAIGFQDHTWNWGSGNKDMNGRLVELSPGKFDYRSGDLWYGHVYVPAQNPSSSDGLNAYGRWHYGPWFWPTPSINEVQHLPIPNINYDPLNPYEPALIPQIPDISSIGESFMDTMVVNGVAYPFMEIDAKVQRFKILNGCADRFLNLHWYMEDPERPGEVRMVDAAPNPDWPESWGMDGREGGVPDPNTRGPKSIQIGNECGFLPHPVEIENQPITWEYDPTMFAFGNVLDHALTLGTAERADIIVDFSDYAGQTLILYNDAPAAFPAQVGQYNYYTDCPDRLDAGGAPSTKIGFGPNIRTVMQIRVRPSSGSTIHKIELVSKGECYTKPKVDIVSLDEGSNASAEAMCHVEGVSLTNLGSEYNAETVTVVASDPPPNGTTAVLEAVVQKGKIIEIKVVNGGSGYKEAPLITINGGINATASATLVVDAVILSNIGSAYTVAPKVVVYDEVGVGRRCTAIAYLKGGENFDLDALNDVFAKNSASRKPGVFELTHEPIIVPSVDYGTAYDTTDFPVDTVPRQAMHYYPFKGLDGKTHEVYIEPKAIQDEQGEVFDAWGRGMLMMGLEIPFSNPGNMNFVMYPYASPPVDIAKGIFVDLSAANSNELLYDVAATEDGTQIWRITHNGVDTHTIHIHLFNAQLLGRVAWDGVLFPPDQNELGFKETFRVNPLQHTYFILRPIVDSSIPQLHLIPNAMRLIDQTMPEGHFLMAPVGGYVDPNGEPVITADGIEGAIRNEKVNFGWEYVWHCHLLAHEEMDMMHSICIAIPPKEPSNFIVLKNKSPANRFNLSWTVNSINATNFVVERSSDSIMWDFLANVTFPSITLAPQTFTNAYVDITNIQYYYRVKAQNVVGAVNIPNFPIEIAESKWSNIASTIPFLTSISPLIVRQGDLNVPMTLVGLNLLDATGLSISGTGISYSSFIVVNSTTITTILTVALNANVSSRTVKINFPGGTTNSMSLDVRLPLYSLAFNEDGIGSLNSTGTILDFGNRNGNISNTVTVTNNGENTITINSVVVTNSTGTAFSKSNDLLTNVTLNSGMSGTVIVKFNAPTGNSVRKGTLIVSTSLLSSLSKSLQLIGS